MKSAQKQAVEPQILPVDNQSLIDLQGRNQLSQLNKPDQLEKTDKLDKTEKTDKSSKYVSKQPNRYGVIEYSAQEHQVWHTLYNRQTQLLQSNACDEFNQGVDLLKLNGDNIPQLNDINRILNQHTGWSVERVPALIGFERFFGLLAERKFPAATFIRRMEDLDYIKEPDIFHELLGHCPLLTHPAYADFSQYYGQLGLAANKAERAMLARLYWFTIEFGLVDTTKGLKIYGGGILSSFEESDYSLHSPLANRRKLDVIEAFRTHYRIDELQKNYFIIEKLEDLQQIMKLDLIGMVKQAQQLGMKPSDYKPKEDAAC